LKTYWAKRVEAGSCIECQDQTGEWVLIMELGAGSARWIVRLCSDCLELLKMELQVRLTGSPAGKLGQNGVRDPEFPCGVYLQAPRHPGAACETDGHYLCGGCAWNRRLEKGG